MNRFILAAVALAGVSATLPAQQAAQAATPSARGAAASRPDSAARPDTSGGSVSVAQRGGRSEVRFAREVYEYSREGRRDPFVSLITSGDLRPLFSDLRLVAVAYDPTGRNSVAVMRDIETKDQYRVKVGQTLGRMRVAQIQPKVVVFVIEEFGYSRQERLELGDSTQAGRKQ